MYLYADTNTFQKYLIPIQYPILKVWFAFYVASRLIKSISKYVEMQVQLHPIQRTKHITKAKNHQIQRILWQSTKAYHKWSDGNLCTMYCLNLFCICVLKSSYCPHAKIAGNISCVLRSTTMPFRMAVFSPVSAYLVIFCKLQCRMCSLL